LFATPINDLANVASDDRFFLKLILLLARERS
jgi:hypothetical protein